MEFVFWGVIGLKICNIVVGLVLLRFGCLYVLMEIEGVLWIVCLCKVWGFVFLMIVLIRDCWSWDFEDLFYMVDCWDSYIIFCYVG